MAESGLSLAWAELKQSVGFYLGHGTTIASWSAAQVALIESLVQSGVRRVYYPPAMSPETVGYEWSFLRPSTTLLIGASGTDGTIVGAAFDSATYVDWAAQGITTADTVYVTAPTANKGTYGISSVAVGAITLDESPGDATGLTFRINRDPANYDLPDSFSQLIGNLHYAPDETRSEILQISVGDLLELRSREDRSDYPSYVAVRSKSSDRTTGQRSELLLWPAPNIALTLYYAYEAYSGALSDTYPYTLGGMHLAELYTESCLAVAEQRTNDEVGLHTQMYQTLLLDAIARDRKKGAKTFGPMGHRETTQERIRHGMTGGTYPLTYNGEAV